MPIDREKALANPPSTGESYYGKDDVILVPVGCRVLERDTNATLGTLLVPGDAVPSTPWTGASGQSCGARRRTCGCHATPGSPC